MKLSDLNKLTDSFKCPFFAFNNATLSYKACIGRQFVKTVHGGALYPECVDCKDGKEIQKFFKNYKYSDKEVKKIDTSNKNGKKFKKGESPYSRHYTGEAKIQSQGSQVVRHRSHKPNIGGSIPPPATKQLLYDWSFYLKLKLPLFFN